MLKKCLILSLFILTTKTWAGINIGKHAGYDGWWLDNAVAEAFVIAKPFPRIVVFRLKGETSPLMIRNNNGYFGIRTWFFEQEEVEHSRLPAEQPATMQVVADNHLQLIAEEDKHSYLQLTMDIKLVDDKPILKVNHGLKNLFGRGRRLALWALNVVEPEHGVGIVPWKSTDRRSLLFWPTTNLGEKAFHFGEQSLAIDFRIKPEKQWHKLGTNSDAGWVAYVWDNMALKSSVEHTNLGEYPEDGATVTLFNSTSELWGGLKRGSEIENIGPLTYVAPQKNFWMLQTLELKKGIKGSVPDQWLAQLQ